MKDHMGSEKRKYFRLDSRFVVSYRAERSEDNYDITQTKNVSQGGALITTGRYFRDGERLVLIIRFPFLPHEKIEVLAEVVGSKEIRKDAIYDIRIKFLNLDKDILKRFEEFAGERTDEEA